MADTEITSQELVDKNINMMNLPTKADDFTQHSLWHYTSLETADKILESKSMYLNTISSMNDIDEIELHKTDKDFTNCLCLCNSNTEKIPMWYLYSGIAGKGMAIGFPPSNMLKLISSIETLHSVDDKRILKKDVDFDIECGWIFYRHKDEAGRVKFKGKNYLLKDYENFPKDNFFIKAYPWEYEKEFRIVVKNKTGEKYEHLKLDISSVYDKLKLKRAPEISDNEFYELLPNLAGIKKFLQSKVEKSNLQINMNLFRRNYDSFVSYICREFENGNKANLNLYEICNAIKSAEGCKGF